MKRKIVISVLCLALMSLACLTSGMDTENSLEGQEVATRINLSSKSAADDPWGTAPSRGGEIADDTSTPEASMRCARVIALKTLNLRTAAGTSAEVNGYLRNGEEVQLLNDAGAGWWKVQRGDDIGFARSVYLREVECEVSDE